jgi:hypothetical protein
MAERADKDVWDKIDILAKLVIAIFVSGGIGFYTFYIAEKNRDAQVKLQVENRKAQTLIQMLNARESAMGSLRTSMFKILLDHFLSDENLENQVVMLEMIGLNFRDSLQIKPMFERLDRALVGSPDESTTRQLLRDAARSVIWDQLGQIQRAENGNFCEVLLEEGKSKQSECFPPLEIKLLEVQDDHIRVRTNTKNGRFVDFEKLRTIDEENSTSKRDSDLFNVSYFDMPMIDYTHVNLDEPLRYSIVLLKTEAKEATIVLSLLPTADYSADNRYVFDEAVKRILTPLIETNELTVTE